MIDTSNAAAMGRRSAAQFVATGIPRRCPYPLDSDNPTIKALVTAYAKAYTAALPPPKRPVGK